MDRPCARDLQASLLGRDPNWWRHAYTVANGIYAVRTYSRVAASQHTIWDHDPMFDPSHCRSCTRPLRLFAQIHHGSTLFCKRWKSQCTFCEWKVSNADATRLASFKLWPPKLNLEQWERIVQFLCQEGRNISVGVTPQRVTLASPHLHQLLSTALRRTWHSVLLTGLDQADEILWKQPELLAGIYTSGTHSHSKSERAAWALLSLLCSNPMWLLVASCCPASAHNRTPTCGRPLQVMLAFLGSPHNPRGLRRVSLDQGCNPQHSPARVTAGSAKEAFTSRPAFLRWAGRGRFAKPPSPAPTDNL